MLVAQTADASAADRRRVGDYVRRALPGALERGGCDWPCTVDWTT
jgi:hypothetical protein